MKIADIKFTFFMCKRYSFTYLTKTCFFCDINNETLSFLMNQYMYFMIYSKPNFKNWYLILMI